MPLVTEKSLKLTCGALVPEKTACWLVSFKWEHSQWRYVMAADVPGIITVDNILGKSEI
jgi:hypothetical protein